MDLSHLTSFVLLIEHVGHWILLMLLQESRTKSLKENVLRYTYAHILQWIIRVLMNCPVSGLKMMTSDWFMNRWFIWKVSSNMTTDPLFLLSPYNAAKLFPLASMVGPSNISYFHQHHTAICFIESYLLAQSNRPACALTSPPPLKKIKASKGRNLYSTYGKFHPWPRVWARDGYDIRHRSLLLELSGWLECFR